MLTLRQIVPALCAAAALAASAAPSSVFAAGASAAPPDAAEQGALGAPDAAGVPDAPGAPDAAGVPDAPGAPDAPGWHHGPHGGAALGPMGMVLHQLNLTADQKTQIKSILAGQKSQFDALRESSKANHRALAATPPTDPGYPALIQTAQTNAATLITLMSSTWKQIYESVLTKAQRDQIPAVVAAAEKAHESRMTEWKSGQALPE